VHKELIRNCEFYLVDTIENFFGQTRTAYPALEAKPEPLVMTTAIARDRSSV
jgi:hypothetical protein